jgi:AcrR family transcriptional regulator
MIRAHILCDPTGGGDTRERILSAAYDLFSTRPVGAVGVDTIVRRAGVAKMSLYKHFDSKEGLVLAFLDRREALWTRQWLHAEISRRTRDPAARLLAIFDVFHEWFQEGDFEGCAFVKILLEAEPGGTVHTAAALHLTNIRAIVADLAERAGLAEPATFARTWHILMNGAMISASEGDRDAARVVHRAATAILEGWPRVPA